MITPAYNDTAYLQWHMIRCEVTKYLAYMWKIMTLPKFFWVTSRALPHCRTFVQLNRWRLSLLLYLLALVHRLRVQPKPFRSNASKTPSSYHTIHSLDSASNLPSSINLGTYPDELANDPDREFFLEGTACGVSTNSSHFLSWYCRNYMPLCTYIYHLIRVVDNC